MEQLKYAGLRTEDKAALLDAKAKGAEWVARDSDSTGMICGFHNKPRRFTDGEWITDDGFVIGFRQTLRFVKAKSAEPVNINAALAQIAEMEAAQTPTLPPTWNDALNAMSAEEKVEMIGQIANGSCAYCVLTRKDVSCMNTDCKKCIAELFASPYDGGKAQEGAE